MWRRVWRCGAFSVRHLPVPTTVMTTHIRIDCASHRTRDRLAQLFSAPQDATRSLRHTLSSCRARRCLPLHLVPAERLPTLSHRLSPLYYNLRSAGCPFLPAPLLATHGQRHAATTLPLRAAHEPRHEPMRHRPQTPGPPRLSKNPSYTVEWRVQKQRQTSFVDRDRT